MRPISGTITIPQRFTGPPDSANGGYACGMVARALGDGPAEVTLRRPVPVERPLHVARSADRAALYDDDQLVAEARPIDVAEVADKAPTPVSFLDAQRAAQRFDVQQYAARHRFPGCFTCGPHRSPGDGLRIFPAAASRRLVVWPWVPDVTLADDDGLVQAALVWAVLDCPSGLAWYHERWVVTSHVLGRMTAAVHRRPAPGERLVAAGWAVREDGRKRLSGSAIWAADGEVLAENHSTWIEPRPT
jgi:hypothetical protein